jgi:ABC-2 type transport system permease protein
MLQIRRDPLSLAMAFLMPALLLIIFGYAITLDVNNLTTIVYDGDQLAELIGELTASVFYHRQARRDAARDRQLS